MLKRKIKAQKILILSFLVVIVFNYNNCEISNQRSDSDLTFSEKNTSAVYRPDKLVSGRVRCASSMQGQKLVVR